MRSRSMNPFPHVPAPPEPMRPVPAPTFNPPEAEQGGMKKLLGSFQTDDYILIGIIAVLFFEGCDDYILLAALGYLFFMGIL